MRSDLAAMAIVVFAFGDTGHLRSLPALRVSLPAAGAFTAPAPQP